MEAKKSNGAARLWISGLEALQRVPKVPVQIYDLSATPFYLRGSGEPEGTLFPWVVCDFSLIDAIECGIVKVPRVPVQDVPGADLPIYRHTATSRNWRREAAARRAGEADHRPQPGTVAQSAHRRAAGTVWPLRKSLR